VADSRIGIKVADGSFFPVMEEGKASRKRLVLTTVKDDQANVQIDLYRSEGEMDQGSYVGSLLIEHIPPKEKGEPEIELLVGMDDEGNLLAEASEKTSGEKRSLSVHVGDSREMTAYDIPDFDLSEESSPGFEPDFSFDDLGTSLDESDDYPVDDFSSESYDDEESFSEESYSEEGSVTPRGEKSGGARRLLIVLLVLLSLAFIALLIYFLMNFLPGKDVEPLRATGAPVAEAPAEPGGTAVAEPEPETPSVPVKPADPPGPLATDREVEKVRVEVPGVWYRIRRGDTLWGISRSFYSTPWLYGQIAEENEIRNPDLIFAEEQIFIPSR
jgi:hypothetical protein